MSISPKLRNGTLSLAALGALALGGSAIAGAATSSNGSSTSTTQAAPRANGAARQGASSGQRPDPTKAGGHVGQNGKVEQALSTAVAAKVEAAAEAKLPGGTVLRVETDVDHGSPYEAHVRTSDGTEIEVLVNDSFQVAAVNATGWR
jgi:hypothetical protein